MQTKTMWGGRQPRETTNGTEYQKKGEMEQCWLAGWTQNTSCIYAKCSRLNYVPGILKKILGLWKYFLGHCPRAQDFFWQNYHDYLKGKTKNCVKLRARVYDISPIHCLPLLASLLIAFIKEMLPKFPFYLNIHCYRLNAYLQSRER